MTLALELEPLDPDVRIVSDGNEVGLYVRGRLLHKVDYYHITTADVVDFLKLAGVNVTRMDLPNTTDDLPAQLPL